MTNNQTISTVAAEYMAYITTELLLASGFKTADQIDMPCSEVAREISLPAALLLERLENELFKLYPDMWAWGTGVYFYEVVEPLGTALGLHIGERGEVPDPRKYLADCFCTRDYWSEDTPDFFFADAKRLAQTI